jgi:tRNA threonylcarbamoyladenosine biosynthesis protein TsaB
MNILSLDTAMGACSAAVSDSERGIVLAECCRPMQRGHAEALAPMVAQVMKSAGLAVSDIGCIAVTIGPGTFTGTRLGLAFAQGLARSCGIPAVGIDSLSAIAANEPAGLPLLVASDAGNGQVYAATFDQMRNQLQPPHISTPHVASRHLPPGCLVLGTAAQSVIEASGRGDLKLSTADNHPVAARFGRFAAEQPEAMTLRPLYLRPPDAKPQAQQQSAGNLRFETTGAMAAPVLAELHAEAFGTGWSAAEFQSLLDIPGTSATVALDRGRPVAMLVTRQADDEAEVISIGTRPADQRRGIARQLLAAHFSRPAHQGIRRIFLEVAASNVAAQSLYTGLGFREVGRRRDYYARASGREDAIILRKDVMDWSR